MKRGFRPEDCSVILWAVWKPLSDSILGEGKRVTWQTQVTLTETERLVRSAERSTGSSAMALEGSACEPNGRGSSSSGWLKSNSSTARFLVARAPRRTEERTSNDEEELISSGGLFRFPCRGRGGRGMARRRQKRRSVDSGAALGPLTGPINPTSRVRTQRIRTFGASPSPDTISRFYTYPLPQRD